MESQIFNLKLQSDSSNVKSRDVKTRAYLFSIQIVRFVNELPKLRGYWSIGDQLLRAATSIGANMIEAQAGSSKRDFIKFYEIALKSANETKYWISLFKDSSDDKELKEKCEFLLKEAVEIANMVGSSVLTLKGKKRF